MSASRGFIKKIAYAVGANLLSLLVSVLTTLIVPKFLGDDIGQYGYFQVYLFYVGYIGFFHFGWCDGIYLRDGGKHYSDLDKPLYASQFWLLTIVELIIASLICVIGFFFASNEEYSFISFAIAINIFIFLPRTMLSYYLQTTNRIKEYSSITTIGRTIYGIAIILIVMLFSKDYRHFIWGDIIGKFIALLVSIWWCRDIVFSKPATLRRTIDEIQKNISVGIKLLFANIASMLITGIVRWGVQTEWDVATYGKISFTLSVSNLLLTFISAVALVLYPTLRRSDERTLKGMYEKIKNTLMIPLLGCLILYYPIESILSVWLPQYAESMRYMAILFPMCICAAKMTMLIQTYMKVFRMEKQMLYVNIVGVIVAVVTTAITVFWLKNLTLAMVSMVANQMFRCIYAECVLAKEIQIHCLKDTIFEVALTILFILANWFVGSWSGVSIYLVGYLGYLFLKRKDVKLCLKNLDKGKVRY